MMTRTKADILICSRSSQRELILPVTLRVPANLSSGRLFCARERHR